MKITCTRKIGIDAGHRVVRHESKCRHLHGHRYTVEITAEADALDDVGRVIDFGVLKEKVGGWLLNAWDHGLILWEMDPLLPVLRELEVGRVDHDPPRELALEGGGTIPIGEEVWRQKVWIAGWNPTAENMAKFLLNELCPLLLDGTGVRVVRIVVWETPNCFAEAMV